MQGFLLMLYYVRQDIYKETTNKSLITIIENGQDQERIAKTNTSLWLEMAEHDCHLSNGCAHIPH